MSLLRKAIFAEYEMLLSFLDPEWHIRSGDTLGPHTARMSRTDPVVRNSHSLANILKLGVEPVEDVSWVGDINWLQGFHCLSVELYAD